MKFTATLKEIEVIEKYLEAKKADDARPSPRTECYTPEFWAAIGNWAKTGLNAAIKHIIPGKMMEACAKGYEVHGEGGLHMFDFDGLYVAPAAYDPAKGRLTVEIGVYVDGKRPDAVAENIADMLESSDFGDCVGYSVDDIEEGDTVALAKLLFAVDLGLSHHNIDGEGK